MSTIRPAIGAVLTLCLGAPALAQNVPADKPASDALETVTVTAEFKKENLQLAPLAITAITAATLDARSQTTLQDITAQAPNVTLQQVGAGGGNSMRALIRGIGQSDFDPALDPGVGIYIDDVYFGTLVGSDFALIDLDRVEILRGPQGTLSGMNSVGGSVKLFTQKPSGSNDGYIEATYGSYSRIDVRASADFSLVPDSLFVRLTGVSRHQDGYVTLVDYACSHPSDPDVIAGIIPHNNYAAGDCKTGTEGGIQYTAARASLRWLAAPGLEVNWVTDATNDNSGSTANSLIAVVPNGFTSNTAGWFGSTNPQVPAFNERYLPPNPYVNYANFLDPGTTYRAVDAAGNAGPNPIPNGPFYANPNNTYKGWGTSFTVDWKLADTLSLKSITAYRAYTSTFGDDNSDSPVPLVLEEAKFTHAQFSQELRLSGTAFGSLMDYTAGGIFFRQHTEYASREDDPGISASVQYSGFLLYGGTTPTFDFLGDPIQNLKTEAGFVNTAWHPFEGFTFDAGARYTHEYKTFAPSDYNLDGVTPFLPLNPPGNPEGLLNGTVGVFDGSHVDYRLDVSYRWTPGIMTYASWATGFKGAGISPRAYYPQQVVGFGPETMNSYEAGIKTQWLNDHLRANLAVFREDYKDIQASANDPKFCVDKNGQPLPAPYNNPCGEYINAADGLGKGIEVEMEARLADHLSIDAAYSYLDLHVTRTLVPGTLPVGSPIGGVGKSKGSIGIQYEAPLGSFGSLTPRIDAAYTPGFCGDLGCTDLLKVAPYTLVNGRLTYWAPGRGWNVALQVTNLTNKVYYISKTSTGLGYVDGQIGMPRMWAVTLHKQF